MATESKYWPVEGECLGVVWALKKAKYFIQGCEKLVVAVDHTPLLGVLRDYEVSPLFQGCFLVLNFSQ